MQETVDLWDWRRRISDLYGAVRADPDPRHSWEVWRRTRNRLFRTHPQTPLDEGARAEFPGVPYFPYDPAWRFTVALRPVADTAPVSFPGGADGMIGMRPFALTDGLRQALGGELTLYWVLGYGGGVFLPFADASNGAETYAGGRYLLDSIKGADLGGEDGCVVLDFNFAYCPSCAYSPHWVCPLPPAANRLPRPVCAGERTTATSAAATMETAAAHRD